jgi:hypothetical protein
MSDYRRCEICKEWGWFPTHTCGQRWYYREYKPKPDDMEPDGTVYDNYEDTAAEKAGEQINDSGDYQKELDVWVSRDGENWVKYNVHVEHSPVYHANKAEDE